MPKLLSGITTMEGCPQLSVGTPSLTTVSGLQTKGRGRQASQPRGWKLVAVAEIKLLDEITSLPQCFSKHQASTDLEISPTVQMTGFSWRVQKLPELQACTPARKQGAGAEVALVTPSMCHRPLIWPAHAVSAPTTGLFHCHLCVPCWHKSWPPGPRMQANTFDLKKGH